jgi:uncharacterized protein YndB with AHSA1/START domain
MATEDIIVTVTRGFTASCAGVFEAWFNPDLIKLWMFGSRFRDEEVISLRMDPRVGGHFSFIVKRHGVEIEHQGKYLEIKKPHLLRFTWGIKHLKSNSVVNFEIIPLSRGCKGTLTQYLKPEYAEFASRVQESWSKMLAVLSRII